MLPSKVWVRRTRTLSFHIIIRTTSPISWHGGFISLKKVDGTKPPSKNDQDLQDSRIYRREERPGIHQKPSRNEVERCPGAHSLNIVFYNYADSSCLGEWFVQLYTESIQERGGGANVVNAKGPTSNHSILNGIIAGPRDKVVLFLNWEELGSDLVLPKETGMDSKLTELEGLSMTHMQTASYRGTALDFSENGVPNATLTLPSRDIQSVCQLMRLLMDTIAIKGRAPRFTS